MPEKSFQFILNEGKRKKIGLVIRDLKFSKISIVKLQVAVRPHCFQL